MTTTTGVTTLPNSNTTTPITSAVSNTANSDKTNITADYDKFLLLLTTQMKNQDPTQPMDATQQIAQLAQFSSVEQQVKMNQKFDTLISKLTSNDLDRASTYLGKSVTAPMGGISWNGTDASSSSSFSYTTSSGAKDAVAVITDHNNHIIRRIPLTLSATDTTVSWDGKKDDGAKADVGNYNLVIQNTLVDSKGIETQSNTQAVMSSRVLKAVNDPQQGVMLSLSNGQKININNVTGVIENTAS